MKIILLSDPSSSHTVKWARSLADANIELLIFGICRYSGSHYDNYKSIRVVTFNQEVNQNEGAWKKGAYLKGLPLLKKIIKEFQPDIVHSHYATSYGLLGALSGFHPFVLSVWGCDVFSFPHKSFVHSKILQFNLFKADRILSTSHVMAKETLRYTKKPIEVTPFGIDLNIFQKQLVQRLFEPEDIVIGTVKTLEEKYGIEYLVHAFRIVCDRYPALPLKLLIVGGGRLDAKLKMLVAQLGLQNKSIFTGKVSYDEVPSYLNLLSIAVSVSISHSESFGVAVLEASACEKPVVVSNVGGLPEVVEDDVTGFVVRPKDPLDTANAIEKLILDAKLRRKMGQEGRKRVNRLYNWQENVSQMVDIYRSLLSGKVVINSSTFR